MWHLAGQAVMGAVSYSPILQTRQSQLVVGWAIPGHLSFFAATHVVNPASTRPRGVKLPRTASWSMVASSLRATDNWLFDSQSSANLLLGKFCLGDGERKCQGRNYSESTLVPQSCVHTSMQPLGKGRPLAMPQILLGFRDEIGNDKSALAPSPEDSRNSGEEV